LAIGSGRASAYAAFYSWRDQELRPEERVRLALEAAEEYTNNVRGPFDFVETAVARFVLAQGSSQDISASA
jgi:ATP-dependent protease HslVU (ClpYQ) peptidase subunit